MQSESNTKLPAVTVERHGGMAVVTVRKGFKEFERDGDTFHQWDEQSGVTPWHERLEESVSADMDSWFDSFKEQEEERRNRPLTAEEYVADITAKLDVLMEYQGLTVRDLGGGVFEVVKQTSGLGTAEEPYAYASGVPLRPNAYYTYGGTRYVFVDFKERVATDWATDGADMEAF